MWAYAHGFGCASSMSPLCEITDLACALENIPTMQSTQDGAVQVSYHHFVDELVNKKDPDDITIEEVFARFTFKAEFCTVCASEGKRMRATSFCFGTKWLCTRHFAEHSDTDASGLCKYEGSHSTLFRKSEAAFKAFNQYYKDRNVSIKDACKMYPCAFIPTPLPLPSLYIRFLSLSRFALTASAICAFSCIGQIFSSAITATGVMALLTWLPDAAQHTGALIV
jgi:hypothetical protein